jgi:hypothetical protein
MRPRVVKSREIVKEVSENSERKIKAAAATSEREGLQTP